MVTYIYTGGQTMAATILTWYPLVNIKFFSTQDGFYCTYRVGFSMHYLCMAGLAVKRGLNSLKSVPGILPVDVKVSTQISIREMQVLL